jgi:hypothetical protein
MKTIKKNTVLKMVWKRNHYKISPQQRMSTKPDYYQKKGQKMSANIRAGEALLRMRGNLPNVDNLPPPPPPPPPPPAKKKPGRKPKVVAIKAPIQRTEREVVVRWD